MIHSIISWDCCFRNFFHLIGSLAEQDYAKEEYEFIFVEQRSKNKSDEFNHALGLKSLGDTVDAFKNKMNVRAVYLDKDELPYHLGIANNAGISEAKGKYISVMDGDLLVSKDFLKRLEQAHLTKKTILNLDRRYASSPVGVTLNDWTKAKIDFDLVLNECKDKDRAVPEKVDNKGPMISAPAEWWKATGGYDEHRIFSTGVSRLGQDITKRLELFSGKESIALPGTFCVHPYHPMGFDRDASVEKLVLHAQQKIIDYTSQHKFTKASERIIFEEEIYLHYKWAVEANISGKKNFFVHTRAKGIDYLKRAAAKLK